MHSHRTLYTPQCHNVIDTAVLNMTKSYLLLDVPFPMMKWGIGDRATDGLQSGTVYRDLYLGVPDNNSENRAYKSR